MFIAVSHWSGLRPLASATLSILDSHRDSSWLSIAVPCCGDPTVLDLRNCPLHMLQKLLDGVRIGVSQPIGLDLPWVVAKLVSRPALPHPHHHVTFSIPALASSPSAAGSKKWGHFPHSHPLGASSPSVITPGPALLCCLGEVLGCSPKC